MLSVLILPLFLVVGLFLNTSDAFAQPVNPLDWPGFARHLRFEHLPLGEKRSNFIIYKILQDQQGFMWFATVDGIYKYDGYNFVLLQYIDPDSTVHADKITRAMVFDKPGTLWYGSDDGVIGRLTGSAEVPDRVHIHPHDSTRVAGGSIYALCEDKAGTMWVGTSRDGIFAFDSLHKKSTHYIADPKNAHSLSDNRINALCMDGSGILWVATDSCLNAFDPSTGQFTRYAHEPSNAQSLSHTAITTVYADTFGVLWVGTKEGGLNAVIPERQTGSVPEFTQYNVGDKYVSSVYRQDLHTLWVCTRRGVSLLDPVTGSLTVFEHDQSIPTSLRSGGVRSVFVDRAGDVWIGTEDGLDKVNRGWQQFTHVLLTPYDPEAAPIFSVFEDAEENLWIGKNGAANQGLRYIDRRKGRQKLLRPQATTMESLSTDDVSVLLPDRFSVPSSTKGVLWVGTWEGGLNRLDIENGTCKHILWAPREHDNNVVYSLYQDSSGTIWIGTLKEGLIRFDPETEQITRIGLEDSRVRALAEDHLGVLWIGTERGGLFSYDRLSHQFENYRHNPSDPQSIRSNSVTALFENRSGSLWVGTRDGLCRYDRERHAFRQYANNSGLKEDLVQRIVEDGKGYLWVSFRTLGIARLNPRGDTVEVVDTRNGLLSNEFKLAACVSRRGEIIFGMKMGLTIFHPDSLHESSFAPPVVLTSFKVFESPVGFSQVNKTNPLQLTYNQNFFSFEFAALDFADPATNVYAYKLEGVDADWVHSGAMRSARYTGVEPGRYYFRVRAAGSDGVWNTQGASIELIIAPPYWKTWWFRVLMMIAVLSMLVGAYKYRVRKLLEVERLRLRIARDLHDDVGSRLGTIALLSDVIKQRLNVKDESNEELTEIAHHARSTADALRDLVWLINPESDSLDQMVLRMKDAASTMLRNHEVSFHTDGQRFTDVKDIEFRRNFLLVYKEMLHNVLKHACATHVEISLLENDGKLELCINDNGTGFNEGSVTRGNGLKNMRARAVKLGGSLQIESTPDKGTRVVLTAIIP